MYIQLLKLFLVCVIPILFDIPCLAQSEYHDNLKPLNIKGNVDSILNTQYLTLGGDSTIGEIGTWVVSTYSKDGLLLQDHYYPYKSDKMGFDMKDPRSIRNINHYDSNGELLDKTNYDEQGKAYTKDVYIFNPSGLTIEVKHYYLPNSALIFTTKLSLDVKGKIISSNTTDELGKPISHHLYKYDKNNYCIEDISRHADNSGENRTVYSYQNDDLIKEIHYDNTGKILTTYTYEYPKYDEKHNWVIKRNYTNGRLFQINERIIIYRK